MLKMPSLFVREWDRDCPAIDQITPGCGWVFDDDGVKAYRKWDGTCCVVLGGELYKRYDCKPGKTAPDGFQPLSPAPIEGHWMGWVPLTEHDYWHLEAWEGENVVFDSGDLMSNMARLLGVKTDEWPPPDGTYELCGPKVGGNNDGLIKHVLIQHTHNPLHTVLRNYLDVFSYLDFCCFEGVVWHHPDGRMCKVKRSDFGLEWPIKEASDVVGTS